MAACSGPEPIKGANCFPAEAARWVYLAPDTDALGAPKKAAPKATSATIYVDRSASMLGFVDGATNLERPFQDLIGAMPAALREIGATSEYRGFGTTISAPLPEGAAGFSRRGFYSCKVKGDPGCESHIDDVMKRVADKPNDVAIVLTDLWFDNSEVQTSGLTALQPALTHILDGGRTVAVYGIDAPFGGMIYDLPVSMAAEGKIPHHGRHPLFMLAIGTKSQILALHEQLVRSGSHFISDGVASGRIKRSLFMVDPGPDHPHDKTPMAPAAPGSELAQTKFEGFGRATIQQFVMGASTLPKPGVAPIAGPTWTAPARDAFVEKAVWEGEMRPRVRLWRRKDDRCTPTSWIGMGTIEGDWEAAAGGQQRFTLSPKRLFARTRQNGVYLVSGELERVSVNSPNAADAWMRAWSLAPEDAPAAALRDPELFPTLNLSEVARIMEGSLASAAERSGGGITGFSVLAKVDR